MTVTLTDQQLEALKLTPDPEKEGHFRVSSYSEQTGEMEKSIRSFPLAKIAKERYGVFPDELAGIADERIAAYQRRDRQTQQLFAPTAADLFFEGMGPPMAGAALPGLAATVEVPDFEQIMQDLLAHLGLEGAQQSTALDDRAAFERQQANYYEAPQRDKPTTTPEKPVPPSVSILQDGTPPAVTFTNQVNAPDIDLRVMAAIMVDMIESTLSQQHDQSHGRG